MSGQTHRLPVGGLIDRSREVPFSFDGRALTGHPGDTLASALLANGVHLMGRSFKYHRPRGLYSDGPEEPNALVTLGRGAHSEPNIPATMVEIYDGLEARSQNRWPSLAFDALAVNSLLKPFFPAGFYYKTFMWPRSFWYRLYEPVIRRAAGLGALVNAPDPDRYERCDAHCDVLVVGAGPAGLMAAREAARAGARVILADERPEFGGHLTGEVVVIDSQPGAAWAGGMADELTEMDNVQMLARTTVYGRYDGLTFGAVERLGDHLPPENRGVRQRHWTIHAAHLICAAGAIERPLVFPGNDRPGIMLAGAARAYVNRYGVLPGRKAVVFTNNDDAYRTACDLANAGAQVTLIDARAEGPVKAPPVPESVEIHFGQHVVQTGGHTHVSSVTLAPSGIKIDCDILCISGGWNPSVHLLSHVGHKPGWDEETASFILRDTGKGAQAAGGAAGIFNLQETLKSSAGAGRAAASACGHRVAGKAEIPQADTLPAYGIEPLWRVGGDASPGKSAFVDLQNDVTVADLELAAREGFGYAEHAKRYTTLGMATDQGKLANVNALGILSGLNGTPMPETGTTTFRPLTAPVALGAIAGQARGHDFRPIRQTAMHRWHEAQGAVFTQAGLWMRAYYYPRAGEDFDAAVAREVTAVRTGLGMVDVSTLGKIELQGPDAGAFLDRLYINSISKMKVGRTRYGVMLREDGMVFDDGVVVRLAEDHFFITVTTAHAADVMQHMEFCHQVHWPEFDVQFCSVSEGWAAMAVAGPKTRDVLSRCIEGLDLSHDGFPFLAAGEATIGGTPIRIFRVSFSGEQAYEIFAPAGWGDAVWRTIMAAGEAHGITAFGTEAMTVLRIEKGHVAGPELDGRTSADDLGLGRMMSRKKDYIGRAMAGRSGFEGAGRLQLVGVKPVDTKASIRMGAHLVSEPGATGPDISQGHVTSAVYSPTCGHHIGLALLKDGRARMGERLLVVSPLHGEQTEVIVTGNVFVDPEGERMRV